jgi:ribosomal protein S18 acetylase RimI-like enzyme
MEKEALIHLQKDPIKNLSVLGFFSENDPLMILREGNTLLLTGLSDEEWSYVSGSSPDELDRLLKTNGVPTPYLASLEDWMIPVFAQRAKVDWVFSSYRYYLPEDVPVAPASASTIHLKEEDAEYLFTHYTYKKYASRDYLKERIRRGISSGVMKDGKLVSWGMTHDDQAIGMIHTLQAYRRKGLAETILRDLIIQKRELSMPVFLNIEPENRNPQNLVGKLGFQFDRIIHWVKLK